MKIQKWLVSLYPQKWRHRYGEEFETLLEDSLKTPLDYLDVLLGALDAHFNFSDETNWRNIMTNKLRTTALLVFAAYITFIVAGFSLYGFADDSPFVPMMETNLALNVAWRTIQVGSVIGLLSIVIGGAPLAWSIISRAFTSHRQDLQLLLVPLYSFVALVIYFLGMAYLAFNTHVLDQPTTSAGHALMGGLIAIFLAGALASTVAIWKVISRTDIVEGEFPLIGSKTIQFYEFAFAPAVIATTSMLVMFIASTIWFWQAFSSRPDLLAANQGPMMTNSTHALAFTLILMAVAVVMSITGVFRGYKSRKSAAL